MNIQIRTDKSTSLTTSRSITERFLDNPFSFLESQTDSYKEVLNAVLVIDNKKKTGEAYIAELCSLSGYKRTCVKKNLDLLIKDGFIGKVGRYHTSSLFRVNGILHLPHIRTLLSPILRALCFLPFAFLTSTFVRCYTPERPLQLKDIYIKNYINNSVGTKDTQLSVAQSNNQRKIMDILKQFTHMSKRTESDNKSNLSFDKPQVQAQQSNPWKIPSRQTSKEPRYPTVKDSQPITGSSLSQLNLVRRQREEEERLKREFAQQYRKENQPTPDQLWDIINKAGASFMK